MKRFAVLLALLAGAVPVVSGCGAEEAAGVDVAEAAQATAAKGTARMTMTMRMTGLGLPQPMDVKAEGVTALGEPRMNITFDFGNLLAAAGAQGVGKMAMRVDGADLYVQPPEIQALNLPKWISLDLRQVVRAIGIDPDAAGALFTIDPASQLRALKSAGGLEEVGSEEIAGAETTHLKGTMSTKDTIAALPPAKRKAAEEALAQLEKLGGGEVADQRVPVELWVDGDAIVRRMRMTMNMPAQNGAPPGEMQMSYELSDFGAELDVSKPDGVVNYTDELVGALSGAGLKARGGTSSG